MFFLNLVSEIMQHHFHHILTTEVHTQACQGLEDNHIYSIFLQGEYQRTQRYA